MDCAAHPGALAHDACNVCHRQACEECLGYEVDGIAACESCAVHEDERSRAWGSFLLAFVGMSYLATLAVSYAVFRGRPFVGGLAAVVAIACGRALQIFMRLGVVVTERRHALPDRTR